MVPQAEETLLAGGFKKSECDHSLFLLQEKEQFLMLLVYVDDILLFSQSSAMIECVEEMLEMQFKCSKMGDVKYYLGMHVERDLDKGVLRLHQRKYYEGLAKKYGLHDGGKPATPLPSGFTVEPCADEEVVGESDRKLFHSMVGALNYAAKNTRPDIAFATSRLGRVVSCPSHEQLEAAKRLVHYVSATASMGLEYSAVRQRQQRGAVDLGKGEMLLISYTDASFNYVKADGTSIGGYVCLSGGGAARWGLHLGVSPDCKGWEVLDLADNKVVTFVEAISYKTMSLEEWKAEHDPISMQKPAVAPTDPSSTTTPLLAVEDDDVENVTPPSAPTSTSPLPLVPLAPASGIAGGRRIELHLGGQVQKPSRIGEPRAEEDLAEAKSAKEPTAEEKSAEARSAEELTAEDQLDDDATSDVIEVLGGEEGELSAEEQSDGSDVVVVSVEELKPRRSTRPNIGKPAEKLSYHACLPSTSYNTLLDDTDADVDLPELDPDMHADPEHHWDIATMTVKDALARWKRKSVKATMDKEIKSLIANGTWELVERPRGVNIRKNRWVLMTKYHGEDTVAREKACLVVKGFTQVYGTDYDEPYAPVGSYVTLRIFFSIVAVLDLHLMHLNMKNVFLQSKLDRVLYMY
ncbi:unnamed protein product [Closterium sp. NIES-54]